MNGDVFRAPKRDRFGDPVDDDGNQVSMFDKDGLAFVGTLTDIVMGGMSWNSRNTRGEIADTAGMIGVPRVGLPETLPFTIGPSHLVSGDRIDIDGVRYSVVGQRLWDYPNKLTDTQFSHYWVNVTAVTN